MADVTLNIRHNASQAAPEVGQLANEMGRMAAQSKSASTAGTAAANGFRKIGAACLNVGKSAKSGASGISKFTSSLGRIAFYRAIRSAIRYVTDSFKQGLEAAYNWSKAQGGENAKLAAAMDNLKEKAGIMKLQLGAAFGGLIVAIQPILIQIINLVTQAADAITRFFAVLNGSGWYKHAVGGFNDVGNAAGGAGNKIKGLLASWDELTVIGKETGGGGSGGNNGATGDYEWMEAESEWANLFNNGDFFGIGQKINEALGNILTKFNEWLDDVRELHLGTKLAEILNGFFSDPETFKEAGVALSNSLETILEAGIDFFETFDATSFGESVEAFLDGIDWDGISSRVFELIGAAFGGISGFLYGLLKEEIKDAFDDFKNESFDDDGNLDVSGLFDYIVSKIHDAAKLTNPLLYVWEEIAPFFWEGFVQSITDGENLDVPFDELITKPLFQGFDDWIAGLDEQLRAYGNLLWAKIRVSFLESFNNPTDIWILSFFGVDLPGALASAEQALSDAQTQVDNMSNSMSGLSEDSGGAAQSVGELADSWIKLGSGNKNITVSANTTGNDKDGKKMNNVSKAWDWLSGKTNADGIGNITLGVTNNIPAGLDGDIKNVNSSWSTLSSTGKKTVTLNAKQTGVKPNVFGATITGWNNLIGGEKELHVDGDVKEGLKEKIDNIKISWGGLPTGNGLKKIFTANLTGSAKPKDISDLGSGWDKINTKNSTLTANFDGTGINKQEFNDIKKGWGEIDDKTPKFKPTTEISRPVSTWVDKWNALSNKSLELKATLTEKVRDAWNKVARAWNNTSLLSALGTLPTFAQGGFPEEGQLFIANEAGPELVGTMNGQTAVANNDQIVAGITSGVKAAQSEQNALLKQQNAILIELLKKEFVLSPSVGLGQVVSRSATLYGRAN